MFNKKRRDKLSYRNHSERCTFQKPNQGDSNVRHGCSHLNYQPTTAWLPTGAD